MKVAASLARTVKENEHGRPLPRSVSNKMCYPVTTLRADNFGPLDSNSSKYSIKGSCRIAHKCNL